MLLALSLLISINAFILHSEAEQVTVVAPLENKIYYFPFIVDQTNIPLCRFGVNVIRSLNSIDFTALGAGWYADYNARLDPPRPKGVQYVQTIRFQPVGENGYQRSITDAQISEIAFNNVGAIWLIGNEPDRKIYQDNLGPHIYAKAYHDAYQQIKQADPTARVFAGTIVQPTPLRLQYLDLVLASYQKAYGVSLPADGWSIHNFILNEVSCEYDPFNCWGAEIPPGVDADFGEVLDIIDSKRIDLFEANIVRFRRWMYDNGYAGLPLHVSEYGVLFPEDFTGFASEDVNQFMSQTFDVMLHATDTIVGDPNDEYRLVQQFAWYSTGSEHDLFNGHLFTPDGESLSVMGDNYAKYIDAIEPDIDLYVAEVKMSATHASLSVTATVANGGNLITAVSPASVRFYRNSLSGEHEQIGPPHAVSLSGCGDHAQLTSKAVTTFDEPYWLYVVVDEENKIAESDETNNSFAIWIEP